VILQVKESMTFPLIFAYTCKKPSFFSWILDIHLTLFCMMVNC
jgi:hypothetical protein